jgi:hypothetical protein
LSLAFSHCLKKLIDTNSIPWGVRKWKRSTSRPPIRDSSRAWVSDESRIGGGEINLFSDGWDLKELNWDQPGFSDVQRWES